MPWLLLIAAGILEVVWALALPSTRGFTRLWPSTLTLVTMALSFWLLALSVKTIPIAIAYPIWVGIGAAGAYIVSVIAMNEPFRPLPALCVALILMGVAGLKLTSKTTPAPQAAARSANTILR